MIIEYNITPPDNYAGTLSDWIHDLIFSNEYKKCKLPGSDYNAFIICEGSSSINIKDNHGDVKVLGIYKTGIDVLLYEECDINVVRGEILTFSPNISDNTLARVELSVFGKFLTIEYNDNNNLIMVIGYRN